MILLTQEQNPHESVAVNENLITTLHPTDTGTLIYFGQYDFLSVRQSISEIIELISKGKL